MVKRKKRLLKGIDSIQVEIDLHLEKAKRAKEEGNQELADYYAREISGLIKTKERKEKQAKT
jgi:phage shock protein A